MPFTRRWTALAFLPLLAAACSSSPEPDEPLGTASDAVTACVRDRRGLADLAVTPRRCVDTLECPSGAYCNYGFCAFDCDDVTQTCPVGQVCSCTGQCGAVPVASTSRDPLRVSPEALLFTTTGPGARQFLEVEASGGDLGLVRALAPRGLRLSCVDGPPNVGAACACNAAAASCEFTPPAGQRIAVPSGQRRRLWLEVDAAVPLPQAPSWHVEVIEGQRTHVVDVSYVAASAAATPVVGRYEGIASAVTVGPRYSGVLFLGAASPAPAPAVGWTVPVRATVEATATAGRYVMELEDPARSLAVTGRAIIDVSCASGTCSWTLRSADQATQAVTGIGQTLRGISSGVGLAGGRIDGALRAEALGTTSTELVTSTMLIPGSWVGGSPSLGARPLVEWRLSLARTGAATTTVRPAVAQPAAPSAKNPLALEKAMESRYDFTHGFTTGPFGGASGTCRLSDTDHTDWVGSIPFVENCLAEHAAYFATTYQGRYLALAGQLQHGEPVSCEWSGDAPRNFIPCGDSDQIANASVCADGVHMDTESLSCITLGCRPMQGPCVRKYCGNYLDGTMGEGCHDPYTLQNPRPSCEPFVRQYACAPGQFNDGGKVYRGCWLPYAGPDPGAHRDLACSQAYLCNGGKQLVSGTTVEATSAFNQPGDWAFSRSISSSGASLESRDMACAASSVATGRGRPWGTVGFFAQKDVASPRRAPRQMLRACVDDLRRDDAALAPAAAYQTAGCVQKSLFVRSAMWASNPVRRRFAVGGGTLAPTAEDLASDALYLRLVQQWADIAAFVAHEGREERAMADVLLTDPLSRAAVPLDEIFAAEEAAFALLMSPRFAAPLSMIPGEVIAQPDYRRRPYAPGRTGEELGTLEVRSNDEQALGVPVSLLEAVTSYLELVELDLQRQNLGAPSGGRDVALMRLGRAVRTARVVEATANAMFVRAQPAKPSWLAAWSGARARLGAASKRVLELGVTVSDGRHPLGLEADNIPLFYDPMATNLAQHFASSAYMLRLADESKGRADTAFTAATAAWQAWMGHDTAQRQQALSATERADEALRESGRTLQALCGPHRADPRDMLSWIDSAAPLGVPDFGPSGCFLDSSRVECRFDPTQVLNVYGAAPDAAIRFQVCRLGAAKRAAPLIPVSNVASVEAAAQAISTPLAAALMSVTKPSLGNVRIGSGTSSWTFPAEELFAAGGWAAPPEAVAACAERFSPVGTPSPESLPQNPLARPDCYRGDLGELALQVNTGRRGVIRQSERIGELYAYYDIAMGSCLIAKRTHQNIAAAQAKHDQTMRELREEKLAAQTVGATWSAIGAAFALNFGGAGAAVASIATARIEKRMADVQARHDAVVTDLAATGQDLICFNNAKAHLVGLKTAAVDLELARGEAAQAVARFGNATDRLAATVAAGRAEADRQRHAETPILDHEPWLDANRTDARARFERSMRDLRLRGYLASQVVAYEKPTERARAVNSGRAILNARRPADVDDQLTSLRALFPGGVGPGMGRPQNDAMVLSLCRILFDTSDTTPVVDSTRCDSARFRAFLADPSNAAYTPAGDYLGQRLAFTLQPSRDQRIYDCGERVWEMAASAQTSTSLQFGLVLAKGNTFASQECGVRYDPLAPPTLLWASTRPCLNPFLEADPLGRTGKACDASSMTWSPITTTMSRLNGVNDNFAQASYPGNVVTSFAGRGLWGDYELRVPPGQLAPLLLGEVSDIYLRVLVGKSARP